MIGMKNIHDVVSTKELEILNTLEQSLQQEEVQLPPLQQTLAEALHVLDRLVRADNSGAESAVDNVVTIPAAEAATPDIEEQIRLRAEAIYLERGCEDGHADEHWRQAEAEIRGTPPPVAVEPVPAEAPAAKIAPEVEEQIRRRAGEIYVERGGEDGHADEHWLQAETEVMAALAAAAAAEVEEQIRCRAGEIYLERGCEDGHAEEHWMQAEAEIRARLGQPAPVPETRHEERRRAAIRSGRERRIACLASPTGFERRSGQDRRMTDRRMAERAMAVAAGQD